MTTSQDLASIPAADIALLAGGRLATLGCASAPAILHVARADPEALVDGFDADAAHIATARAAAAAARVTGRVAFRHLDPAAVRPRDLPTYDVVVAPAHLGAVAARLAGERGVIVLEAA
jgi:hypothetical protein